MSAPFRIVTRKSSLKSETYPQTETGFKDYLERVLKLIPAEIITLYLTGSSLIPASLTKGWTAETIGHLLYALACLALVVVLRIFGTQDYQAKKTIQWPTVIISSVSFIIWVYQLGGPFKEFGLYYYQWAGSLAIMLWSFVVPLFYKGDVE